ncbi:VanZ family protein [Roseiconus lacunae]|uniref:VanZ family protein n=1 Tax=Roseiconus lacunae TaxID=2605694 RepID=A0ABT7PDM5_9BACT|nr:VanZ family protein [Roseiconus lacunae]MDM4014438.1 VanZ family protein [Roseiconus lacunae]
MRPVTGIKILGMRLGVVLLVSYWIVLFTGTHLPSTRVIAPQMNDKSKHFGGYFVLALLLCYVSHTNPKRTYPNASRFGSIAAVLFLYGCLDEWSQQFARGRQPDVWDLFADACGITSAILFYIVVKRLQRSISTPSTSSSGS